MLSILHKLKERKAFMESTMKAREKEKLEGQDKSAPPIFNRRIFASGCIAITQSTQVIMKKNEAFLTQHRFHLSDNEVLTLNNIVNGLKFLHQGKDYIKKVISNCLTHESYPAFHNIVKKSHETSMSCYFVLSGSLEATYAVDDTNVLNIFQPNIIYSHSMGEYVGLLNHEEGDLAPPATLYTKAPTELLRVDTAKFHTLMDIVKEELLQETAHFLRTRQSVLSGLSDSERDAIIPFLIKETLKSDHCVVHQDASNDYVYVIITGRCQAFRTISGGKTRETFSLWTYEAGDAFGEESALFNRPSAVAVCTKSQITALKLHRDHLFAPGRQNVTALLKRSFRPCPSDDVLINRRKLISGWGEYRAQILAQTVDSNRNMRIRSAPPIMTSQERHFDFLEGQYRSKIAAAWKREEVQIEKEKQDLEKTHKPVAKKTEKTESVAKHRHLLTRAVAQIFTTGPAEPTVDSRELHKKFANREILENKMKQGWIYAAESSNDDLVRNNDLLTNVNSEELILKAAREARLQAEKVRQIKDKQQRPGSYWKSALEDDLRQAEQSLAFHKFRSRHLQRRLASRKIQANQRKETLQIKDHDDDSPLSHRSTTSTSSQSETPKNSTAEEDDQSKKEDEFGGYKSKLQALSSAHRVGLWKGAQASGRLLRIYQMQRTKARRAELAEDANDACDE